MTEINEPNVYVPPGVTMNESEPVRDVPEEAREPEHLCRDADHACFEGGWCAPGDTIYNIPNVTARRGGISFTDPGDIFGNYTKKQLRKRLREQIDAHERTRKRLYKLERKNRRLLKIIEKLV